MKIIVLQDFNPVYTVKKSELMISTVSEQEVSRNIQTIGLIEPVNRVSIESGEYGQIAELFRNSGSFTMDNDPILRLVNEDLENEFSSATEDLTRKKQQLNLCKEEFRSREIDYRDSLLDLDYRLESLENTVIKNNLLFKSSSISRETLENSQNELQFWQQKRVLLQEKWESEKQLQQSREALIETGIESIHKKINYLHLRLGRLIVRAPYSGILNMGHFVVGQTIEKQEKIGIIDRQDQFKLTAHIDEFYLPDVHIGDRASFSLKGDGNRSCEAELVYISPEVQGSKVNLEFSFLTPLGENILSGQSFTIKIFQGEPEVKTVVEYGSFYKESGGNWVYKIEKDRAIKVPVTIGIKNNDYIEILSGLKPGDQIIISNYAKYKDFNKLNIEEI
ncbi:MAG: efflux RND transporter periplasmic adaptor subunit [Spirochaetaceae bacterium]|nr:efflux RND transporter periplasmic adaptor subunit [Spirochaetaceae bacterium]